MSGLAAGAAGVRSAGGLLARDPSSYVLAGGSFAVTAGLAAANGGYFASSWGWSALALFWAAIVALLVASRTRVEPVELALGGAVVALAAWTFVSVAWASSRTEAVLEGQRSLVLVAAVAAVLAVARRRATLPLLAGVLAGAVLISSYALATRLLPDRLGAYDPLATYRLNTPIGYWNGLGLFAGMGALLALAFAFRAQTRIARSLAGASLVVLLPTIYFTFSRGSWVALGVGILVAISFDPRRLEIVAALVVFGVLPATAIAIASRSPALTHQHATLARATHGGHRLLIWLALLAVAQAVLALAYREAQRRFVPDRAVRTAWAAALVLALVAALVVGLAHYGSPSHMVRRAYHSFTAAPPKTGPNLNARLFSLSGSGRWQLWQQAGAEVRAHPWLGGGAGSYAGYWAAHRPIASDAQDAHNLYLETLAELGPIGLALLVAMLGVPLAAAVRMRRHPLVPLALGAYAAYLVHAAVDWDWELSGVTLAALFVGLACVLAARGEEDAGREVVSRVRFGAVAGLVVVSAFTIVGLLGNAAAGAADSAAKRGDSDAAARHARLAIRWAPWSSVGWQQLGEAQLANGDLAGARHSLHRAIGKDPGSWILWLDLASADRGAARRGDLARARALNPLSPEIKQFESGS